MFTKIKSYFEYRKNKRIAKRELAAIAATTLPLIRNFTTKSADIFKFVVRLSEEAKTTESGQLFQMVLSELASVLNTNESRIIEIASYIATLSAGDIQKIIAHSIVETMDNWKIIVWKFTQYCKIYHFLLLCTNGGDIIGKNTNKRGV